MLNDSVLERFWEKVDKSDGCWEWNAGLTTGYGGFKLNGKRVLAHRMSWLITNGSIPSGMNVLHKCGNRKCVNPEHLYIGTQVDNVADAMKAGTHHVPPKGYCHPHLIRKGAEHSNAKLDDSNVREIRLLRQDGMSCRELGRVYGVDHSVISEVVNNKIWKHVV